MFKALESESVIARISALKAFIALKSGGELGNGFSIDPFIKCLNHEDADLRCDAARAIGIIKREDAVEPLLETLNNDPEDEVRLEVVEALGLLGDDKAVDALISVMLEDETEWAVDDDDFDFDPQWDFQHYCARALGLLAHPKAIEPLIKLLREEEAYDISDTIMWSLSRIKDQKATDALLELLKDEHHILRRRAARALVNINTAEVNKALMDALLDKDPGVRANAARSLVNRKDHSVMISLVLLLRDPDKDVRKEVAEIISGADSEEAVERLLPLLDDESSEVRSIATEILGNLKESTAIEKLIEQIKNPDCKYKIKIAVALGSIGSHNALEPLTQLALKEEEDLDDRIEAIRAMGKIGGDEAIEALEALALTEEREIYFPALLAIKNVESEKAAETLIAILKTEVEDLEEEEEESPTDEEEKGYDNDEEYDDDETREDETIAEDQAPDAVDEPGDDAEPGEQEGPLEIGEDDYTGPVEQLEKKEPDPNAQRFSRMFQKRKFVLDMLGSISTPKVKEALLEIAEEGPPELKNDALAALSRLKDAVALSHIYAALESEKRDDRMSAVESLGEIGNPDEKAIVEISKILIEDEDHFCRQAAARVLGVFKSKEAVAPLCEGIKDTNETVRREVVVALGLVEDASAFDTLFEALFDFENFAHIRTELALALYIIGKGKIEGKLAETMEDKEQLVNHWIAIDALTDILHKTSSHKKTTV